MKLDMVITGVQEMRGVFDGHVARSVELTLIVFDLIVDDFQRMSARRFADEGPGWAPLSPTTIALKTRAGYSQPSTPMVATGDLLYSLAGTTEHTVHDITPESLTVGTNLPYARYHQVGPRQIRVFGGPAATLPRRRLVELTQLDAARWAAIVQKGLTGGVRR